MARNASVAETDISKTTSKSIGGADHQEHAPPQERHIAYAGGEQHPSQAARNASVGLQDNENIQIVDWDGPDDPGNPWVALRKMCTLRC